MKEIHVVGAAIIDGRKVLVAQRSPKMSTPLKWEFAGGKVEEGETHEEALCREVYEELGIKIEVRRYIAAGRFETEERCIVLHVYEAGILGGTLTPKEHSQLLWINIKDLKALDWAEADVPACNRLMELYG